MSREPLFGADTGALRSVSVRSLAIRFGFGALLSVVAGTLGLVFGPLVGGAFLAFPAILPATLTLIEKRDGEASARDDDDGALLGAIALVVFAVAGWRLLPSGAPVALTVAGVGWLVTAVALYLLLTWRQRRAMSAAGRRADR